MSYGWRDTDGLAHVEICDECGFDARAAQPESIPGTLALLAAVATEPEADRSPAEGTWSAREYARHCLETCGETLAVVLHARTAPRVACASLPDAARRIAELLTSPAVAEPDRCIELGGPFPVTPRWMLAHLQHDLEHHLLDMRRGHARIRLAATDGPTVER